MAYSNTQCPVACDLAFGTLLLVSTASARQRFRAGYRLRAGYVQVPTAGTTCLPLGARLLSLVRPGRRRASDVGCTLIATPVW